MNNQILDILKQLCDLENSKLIMEGSKLRYEIFQLSDLTNNLILSSYLLTKFYNENFCGNIDFMHIPTYSQVLEDIEKYPIIIAREEGSKVFLGASILKYFDSSQVFDPYYPFENTKYYSVTGILTNEKNKKKGYYGVGKKIYEIALHSVLQYKRIDPDIQVMCVIDCRNKNSINALNCAAKKINSIYGEDIAFNEIVGYYTVEDNGQLVEAPTFVIRINLGRLDVKQEDIKISYEKSNKNNSQMYLDILNIIHQAFQKKDQYVYIENFDPDSGIVKYYPLVDGYLLDNTIINTNGTELGNCRIPINHKLLHMNVKKELIKLYGQCLIDNNYSKQLSLIKKSKYITM